MYLFRFNIPKIEYKVYVPPIMFNPNGTDSEIEFQNHRGANVNIWIKKGNTSLPDNTYVICDGDLMLLSEARKPPGVKYYVLFVLEGGDTYRVVLMVADKCFDASLKGSVKTALEDHINKIRNLLGNQQLNIFVKNKHNDARKAVMTAMRDIMSNDMDYLDHLPGIKLIELLRRMQELKLTPDELIIKLYELL